jgi:hypothetical protein
VNAPTPVPYVAGTVTLAANVVASLLNLIQIQLDENCSGGPRELSLYVSSGGTIYIGAMSPIGGRLSTTNWAHQLTAGQTKIYRSNYPGAQVPLGNLQVLSTGSSATLHVEVLP